MLNNVKGKNYFPYFLHLDFVLRRAPQQGHPRLMVLRKTEHMEHLL